jgi:hypothetical protein
VQQGAVPTLTYHITSLTSLSRGSIGGEQCCQPGGGGGGLPAASSSACGSSGRRAAVGLPLILEGQQRLLHPVKQQTLATQQRRRPIFNFAGLGGDVAKTYHERKLLG